MDMTKLGYPKAPNISFPLEKRLRKMRCEGTTEWLKEPHIWSSSEIDFTLQTVRKNLIVLAGEFKMCEHKILKKNLMTKIKEQREKNKY